MKGLLIILSTLLFLPHIAYATDGYCKCIFKVKPKGSEKIEQVSANSRRPVICESCESRCSLLIDRVKNERNSDDVILDKAECS